MKTKVEDYLGREELVKNIIKIIDNSYNKLSFALSGKWGSGKTFVLDKVENELIERNKQTEKPFLIFKYNCWQYDYYDEPLLAIVSSMRESLKDEKYDALKKILGAGASGAYDIMMAMLDSVNNVLPVSPSKMIESYQSRREKRKAKKNFDDNDRFKKAIDILKKELNKASKDNKIVFLIDELDRCLPEYAIKVLERLHHIFEDVDNSVLVFSVDKKQLDNTVKNIFGNDVEVESYLKKFIDFELSLLPGDLCPSTNEICPGYADRFDLTNDDLEKDIHSLTSLLIDSLPIREIQKIYEKAKCIHNLISGNEKFQGALLITEVLYLVFKRFNYDLAQFVLQNMDTSFDKVPLFVKQVGRLMQPYSYFASTKYKSLSGTFGDVVWLVLHSIECREIDCNGYPVRENYLYLRKKALNKEIKIFEQFITYSKWIA